MADLTNPDPVVNRGKKKKKKKILIEKSEFELTAVKEEEPLELGAETVFGED